MQREEAFIFAMTAQRLTTLSHVKLRQHHINWWEVLDSMKFYILFLINWRPWELGCRAGWLSRFRDFDVNWTSSRDSRSHTHARLKGFRFQRHSQIYQVKSTIHIDDLVDCSGLLILEARDETAGNTIERDIDSAQSPLQYHSKWQFEFVLIQINLVWQMNLFLMISALWNKAWTDDRVPQLV